MTVKRAREIMGEELVNLSDEEVEEFISKSKQFARTILDMSKRISIIQKSYSGIILV